MARRKKNVSYPHTVNNLTESFSLSMYTYTSIIMYTYTDEISTQGERRYVWKWNIH